MACPRTSGPSTPQAQPGREVGDGAALTATAAVVASGAGAGVAGEPARQTSLLQQADLLQADDGPPPGRRSPRARAGAQRPGVAAIPSETRADVERGDAQVSGRLLTHVGIYVGKWLRQKVVSSSLLSRTCLGWSPLRSASTSAAIFSVPVGAWLPRSM